MIIFGAGVFTALKIGRLPIKCPREAKKKEGVTPTKAMFTALAGTLGVGNIVGVASAISLGGAGAVFWMWLSALAAAALKYAETVLAVKHRYNVIEKSGTRNGGGAFAYMYDGGKRRLGLAFAFLCTLTSFPMGAIVQSNAISQSIENSFGIPKYITGVTLALLAYFVISGGLCKIADITYFAVPVFCILYSAVSLYIIIINAARLPEVLARIIGEAFSLKASGGGIFGFAAFKAIRYGVARGILSNEAGSGTSVSAHAASNAESPVKQGMFGIFEVVIDTLILCSMTAFVILLSPDGAVGADPTVTVIRAYSSFLGNIAPGFMSTSVTVFAFGTVICWSVYGSEALSFFVSRSRVKVNLEKTKKCYYTVYSAFILAGAVISSTLIWELADFSVAVMTIINTCYLVTALNEVKNETNAYMLCHNTKPTLI